MVVILNGVECPVFRTRIKTDNEGNMTMEFLILNCEGQLQYVSNKDVVIH